MNVIDIMKRPAAYASGYENIPGEEQNRAKQLCWEYNRTAPKEQQKRRGILQELLGTCRALNRIFTVIMDLIFIPTDLQSSIITVSFSIPHPSISVRVHLSRPVSVWPAPDMRLTRDSAVRESVLLHPSRWKKMYGSEQMPRSAVV